jgi:hypothetical protein
MLVEGNVFFPIFRIKFLPDIAMKAGMGPITDVFH